MAVSVLPSPGLFAAFLAASVLLALTPGPDMAVFLSRTFAGGRPHGYAALLGAMSGVVVHTFAAALGLSALIAASARAYDAVKIAGAVYLLYLAWGALHSGAAHGALAMTTPGDTSMVNVKEVEAIMKGKGARVIR